VKILIKERSSGRPLQGIDGICDILGCKGKIQELKSPRDKREKQKPAKKTASRRTDDGELKPSMQKVCSSLRAGRYACASERTGVRIQGDDTEQGTEAAISRVSPRSAACRIKPGER